MTTMQKAVIWFLLIACSASTPLRTYSEYGVPPVSIAISKSADELQDYDRSKRYFDGTLQDSKGQQVVTSHDGVRGPLNVIHNSESEQPAFKFTQTTTNGGGLRAAPDGSNKNKPTIIKEISRSIYIHVVPRTKEPEPIYVENSEVRQRKHYHIVFIKNPALPSPEIVLPEVNPVNQQKTLVYVLQEKPKTPKIPPLKISDKPEVSKPEVFFLKYNNEEEEDAKNRASAGAEGGRAPAGALAGQTASQPLTLQGGPEGNAALQSILRQAASSQGNALDLLNDKQLEGRLIPVSLDDLRSGKFGNVNIVPAGRLYRDTDHGEQ